MKLIFIRHGEPNYEIDSLTEKGWREAELLSKRTVKWNVTDFYCSPLGRAKDTASFTLKNAGREAEILPWLREFDAPVLDPETGKRRIPWDFLPDVLDANRDLYDNNLWTKNPIMQTGNMDENYHFVTDGLMHCLRATVMYATVTAITLRMKRTAKLSLSASAISALRVWRCPTC